MNTDQLDDLKQFISTSISQSEERMRREITGGLQTVRQEMADGFKELRQEVADGFLGVGEAIDEIHQQHEAQSIKNEALDKRLAKLEQRMA